MDGERLAGGRKLPRLCRSRKSLPCGRDISACGPPCASGKEALKGGETAYILCFKSGSGLAREEIERPIDKKLFDELETKIIGKPLIGKIRRSYALSDGLVLR